MLHQNILKGCIYAFAAIHAYAFIIFVYNVSFFAFKKRAYTKSLIVMLVEARSDLESGYC